MRKPKTNLIAILDKIKALKALSPIKDIKMGITTFNLSFMSNNKGKKSLSFFLSPRAEITKEINGKD